MSTFSKALKSEKNENKVDITKLPKWRLIELLERQNNIASNRWTLKRLPDKGEKILNFQKEIEKELAKRNDAQDLVGAMDGLSLNADLQEIEWTKKIGQHNLNSNSNLDEETDPLTILATHSGTTFQTKIIKKEEDPEVHICEEDIEDAFAVNLCTKLEGIKAPLKFLPNKTLNQVKVASKDKKRDLSSASEPESKFGQSKQVTLQDSLRIQIVQSRNLKEIQLKHAAERLKDKTYSIGQNIPQSDLTAYREKEESEEELSDEEQT